jgi:hypothetical protein
MWSSDKNGHPRAFPIPYGTDTPRNSRFTPSNPPVAKIISTAVSKWNLNQRCLDLSLISVRPDGSE